MGSDDGDVSIWVSTHVWFQDTLNQSNCQLGQIMNPQQSTWVVPFQKKCKNGVKEQPKEQVRWPPPNVQVGSDENVQIISNSNVQSSSYDNVQSSSNDNVLVRS